jgi:alkylhydroperoxidase family enzyme
MMRLPRPDPTIPAAREYGVLAHAPEVLDAFRRLYGALWQHGVVDHPTKEVVRLRNARITDCGY